MTRYEKVLLIGVIKRTAQSVLVLTCMILMVLAMIYFFLNAKPIKHFTEQDRVEQIHRYR